jgi:Ran-binding protein 3
MAYASTSSPFASIKGQNVFKSGKAPSPPPFSGSSSSTVALPDPNAISATASQSSIMAPTATKRLGFAAYASTPSPFAAAARTKSPILGSSSILGRAKSPSRRAKSAIISNPFASYAGAAHSFAIPASKRVRAESADGSSRSSLERNSTVSAFGDSADGSDSGPEDDGDNQTSTFGERLRAAKDYDDEMIDGEPKVQLSEQDGNK